MNDAAVACSLLCVSLRFEPCSPSGAGALVPLGSDTSAHALPLMPWEPSRRDLAFSTLH